MATNGASSTSRRRLSRVREENSASSSVPCVVHAGDLKNDIALRCFRGVYAIMYMSRTISNPNRVFLGCPFYKEKQLHCKFFVWVDEHLDRIGSNGRIFDKRPLVEKEVEVVEEEEEEEFDHRIVILEEKVTALKKKKNLLACCISIIVCVVFVAFYVCSA
ncbi:hypothetical protein Ahy_B08g092115 [Arachis hypogaea]|uniref:Zinc finger GRF-type domain-containing protein n=1 Tax=Arachis hypogaea TaxID=3818 RepID=A0A444Y388_ARAHY|nr:hypothetical protein Ahy_B08g092115 [Arachis hypogaea]